MAYLVHYPQDGNASVREKKTFAQYLLKSLPVRHSARREHGNISFLGRHTRSFVPPHSNGFDHQSQRRHPGDEAGGSSYVRRQFKMTPPTTTIIIIIVIITFKSEGPHVVL